MQPMGIVRADDLSNGYLCTGTAMSRTNLLKSRSEIVQNSRRSRVYIDVSGMMYVGVVVMVVNFCSIKKHVFSLRILVTL